jgi:hypothetical protein
MTPEEAEALTKYTRFAATTRGKIIEQTVMLERSIDYYIASHFCKTEDAKQEMFEFVLGTERISFRGKINVFKAITQKHNKAFHDSNKTLYEKLSGKIVDRRNRFAHAQLDTGIDAAILYREKKEITFINYDFTRGDKSGKERYSLQRLQEYFDTIFNVWFAINELNASKKSNQ